MSQPVANIPGYYYDATKKRYFKVEKGQTAPATSAYSSDAVKKRKLEDTKIQQAAERLNLNKNRVKRSPALMGPLPGAGIAREFHGGVQQDMGAAAIAASLINRGSIPFNNPRWSPSQNINIMCVVGKDAFTDLSFAFVFHPRLMIDSRYSISARLGPYHEWTVDQLSAMKFDHHHNTLIAASARPESAAQIRIRKVITTYSTKDGSRPAVQLGIPTDSISTITVGGVNPHRPTADHEIHAIAIPDVASGGAVCAIGSKRGILHYDTSAGTSLHWVALCPRKSSTMLAKAYRDIFAVDYFRGHDSIILGGGRPGRCFVTDTRTTDAHWQSFSHGTSITHIKSLNQHHVLVSGLQNKMRIYDLRMVDRQYRSTDGGTDEWQTLHSGREPAFGLVEFPEYKNNAHIKIGLDVDLDTGIVATAHDDGRVALHSLQSGKQLESPEVDKVKVDVDYRGPIKALQFAKMNTDPHSSLFVGAGPHIKVFSYGSVIAPDDDEA
ncbi:hypothetical protein E8E14_005488 [Neopestalotiopsis sp. 37M]|nr:hypothetical protein E8E14_005488 [Neopestalotiopsis sp. 37M]